MQFYFDQELFVTATGLFKDFLKQPITGFHLDSEDHWVADLECGHAQHVRHDPPWTERPWVTTEEGRNGYLGQPLNCVRCDEMGAKIAKTLLEECRKVLTENYESAGIRGLCHEGRWEIALESLKTLDVPSVVEKSLKA